MQTYYSVLYNFKIIRGKLGLGEYLMFYSLYETMLGVGLNHKLPMVNIGGQLGVGPVLYFSIE